jgi:hypothetical protein
MTGPIRSNLLQPQELEQSSATTQGPALHPKNTFKTPTDLITPLRPVTCTQDVL